MARVVVAGKIKCSYKGAKRKMVQESNECAVFTANAEKELISAEVLRNADVMLVPVDEEQLIDQHRLELAARNKEAWDTLYGTAQELVWGAEPIGFLEEFMEMLPEVGEGCRILEAATGEGRNLQVLIRTGAEIDACDASENALNKIPAEIRKQIRETVCDMTDMPYEDGSFDFVLATDVIETLPNQAEALKEIFRVTRKGGHFVCNIPGFDDGIAGIEMTPVGENKYLYHDRFFYHFISEEEGGEMLREAGFEIITSRSCQWWEQSHTDYREGAHSHTSMVFLARKPE
jgi:SAM-dependent methyltransferase